MAFEHEKQQALRMLEAIENGTMSASESYSLLRTADPTLVYFIFTWLRAYYHPAHPAADGVLGRVVEICSAHPEVTAQMQEGQSDSLVPWFEETYNYRDYTGHAFIDLIVEKLEG